MKNLFWAEKNSPDLKTLVKEKRCIVLPVGSTEQHGPHLPTGTDHLIISEIARRVAERVDALLLPLLPYGFSEDHFPRAGTISLDPETLSRVLRDIVRSLHRNGAKNIIILNGHAGQLMLLEHLTYKLNVMGGLGDTKVFHLSPYTAVPIEVLAEKVPLEEEMFIHAEELETSMILALNAEWTDMRRAVREIPEWIPKGLTTPNFLSAIKIVTSVKFLGPDTQTGVIGDATKATRQKGETALSIFVDALVQKVEACIASR